MGDQENTRKRLTSDRIGGWCSETVQDFECAYRSLIGGGDIQLGVGIAANYRLLHWSKLNVKKRTTLVSPTNDSDTDSHMYSDTVMRFQHL
jgi:hypothetical protein